MTSFPELRLWLQQSGYRIEKETISREGKRLYSCLTVRAGEMAPMTPTELWVGRQSNDPLRPAFLSLMAGKLQRALRGQLAASAPDQAEIKRLRQVLAGIRRMEGEL